MRKSILIISPEPWSHLNVSKHHYAKTLANIGYNVYFLNPPIKNGFILNKSELDHIYFINYKSKFKGVRFYPKIFRDLVHKHLLNQIEKKVNQKIDIIWSFDNSRFFDFDFADNRIKIYHQVDLNMDFNKELAAKTSDINFCTTDIIKDELKGYSKKVFKIHHGTNPKALEHNYSTYKKPTKLTATYIGNLDFQYIDRDLFESYVSKFEHIKFKLIGSYDKNKETYLRLSKYKNVDWVGRVESKEIPKYLDQSDILLVIYKDSAQKDQASPHKFMEYFASGRVILSTYTDEYKDKRELLAMTNRNSENVKLFEKVVENIETYNGEAEIRKRRLFAEENSYENQVNRIVEYCKKNDLEL